MAKRHKGQGQKAKAQESAIIAEKRDTSQGNAHIHPKVKGKERIRPRVAHQDMQVKGDIRGSHQAKETREKARATRDIAGIVWNFDIQQRIAHMHQK